MWQTFRCHSPHLPAGCAGLCVPFPQEPQPWSAVRRHTLYRQGVGDDHGRSPTCVKIADGTREFELMENPARIFPQICEFYSDRVFDVVARHRRWARIARDRPAILLPPGTRAIIHPCGNGRDTTSNARKRYVAMPNPVKVLHHRQCCNFQASI